ncbi:MAG: hypothetical protein AAGH15_05370 [Myxococcota bacterium]
MTEANEMERMLSYHRARLERGEARADASSRAADRARRLFVVVSLVAVTWTAGIVTWVAVQRAPAPAETPASAPR